MKKLIIFLVVVDAFVFTFAKSYVDGRSGPLEYSFFIFDRTGHKWPIYKDVIVSIDLKLVSIANDVPSVIWQKRLIDSIRLYDLPDRSSAIKRQFNLGIVQGRSYLVYTVNTKAAKGSLSVDKASWIDKSNPEIFIGL